MAVITGTNGPDVLTGGPDNDQIQGLGGDDQIQGAGGADNIDGGDGNDTIDGGPGDNAFDLLVGSTGNDTYFVESGDTVVELDGEGSDIVYARTSYILSSGAYIELLAAVNAAATDPIDLTGNELNNTIQGNAGANTLSGLAGNDYLVGLGGNDLLDGGDDADIMDGGTGDDRYIVDEGDTIIERAGEGNDIAYARTSYVLTPGAHVEFLAAIDASATTIIHLTGNELNNTIQGNEGGNRLLGGGGDDYLIGLGGLDVLDGGAGNDILVGGTGNDRYFVDSGDTVIEAAGEGSDIVYARTSYTLTSGAHVELLAAISAIATDAIDLTGNELGNTIQGNAGANTLLGLGGIDYLEGLGGNDVLDGGADADRLVGGDGADTFRFSDVSHSVPGNPDRLLDFTSGTDRIDLSPIDANTNTPENDAFTFIGTSAFTGQAGQLRYEVIDNQVHIFGDVNGDAIADLQIIANGTTLTAADFIL